MRIRPPSSCRLPAGGSRRITRVFPEPKSPSVRMISFEYLWPFLLLPLPLVLRWLLPAYREGP